MDVSILNDVQIYMFQLPHPVIGMKEVLNLDLQFQFKSNTIAIQVTDLSFTVRFKFAKKLLL